MESSHQRILDLAAQHGLIRPRALDNMGYPASPSSGWFGEDYFNA